MEKDTQQTVPHALKKMALLLGTHVKNRRLDIPEKFGKGYCAGFVFNEHIRMFIFNYELKKDLVIENPDIDVPMRMILFKFQNIFPDATYLNGLFDMSEKSPVLQGLLQNTQPLLFEQLMFPSLQKIVDEIVNEPVDEAFELFFQRVKAEELICRLLMELEKRDEKHLYPLNSRDIQSLYAVKERMLEHLEIPPVIPELAAHANMSPSTLKRLFRQIFGNSIFSYYQEFRMKEAARLLKEDKLSVSDVGYQLGFTNLSHFSRVFKDHIGLKPKEYSRS